MTDSGTHLLVNLNLTDMCLSVWIEIITLGQFEPHTVSHTLSMTGTYSFLLGPSVPRLGTFQISSFSRTVALTTETESAGQSALISLKYGKV